MHDSDPTPMGSTTAYEPANRLPDVQSQVDPRQIAIDKVGVTSVRYPIHFQGGSSTSEARPQPTVASFDLFVSLSANQRGTHMSRFLQVLEAWQDPLSCCNLKRLAGVMLDRLEAENAYLTVRFPYFVQRLAPVSNMPGLIELQVEIDVTVGQSEDMVITVKGPATSLCPCSKEISEYGAHSQRCELMASVRVVPDSEFTLEELYQHMEQSASAQIFPTLKRPDEKWVTEQAYEHPKFVEDIVRDLAVRLKEDRRVQWFRCSSENFESIHQHDAYAAIEMSQEDLAR